MQGFSNIVQLERFDDSCDQLHECSPSQGEKDSNAKMQNACHRPETAWQLFPRRKISSRAPFRRAIAVQLRAVSTKVVHGIQL